MSSGTALVEQHIASKKRMKLVRIVGPLAMVLVSVMQIWSIVNMFRDLDTDKLTTTMQTEAERVMPRIQTNILQSAERLRPAVMDAFAQYQTVLGPRLGEVFDKEVGELKGTLNDELKQGLADGLGKAQDRQRGEIVKNFPELKEDTEAQTAILDAAKAGAEEWAMGQFTTSLNGHIAAMEDIRNTLNSKFGAGAEGGKEEPQQVMMTYLELMAETMGGDENIIANEEDVAKDIEEEAGK